ncbi:MAG: sporulation protein YqfD [Lachnospiraceae bacterium]|nr:sporulation protein YqfD [Lachnospiraceae bacterium]
MLQTIQYFKGYLCIKVWGFSAERFINLCGNHNILLWNIINHGDYYTMCITLKGFYELKSITKKTGTKVAITKRCGLPFFSQRMKKRKVFVLGFLGCLLFLIWTESFILSVDVTGNYYITDEVFEDFLKKQEISPGIKKNRVDIESLEKAIRNEYNIVTWTSARMEGTKLVIQIKENDLSSKEEEVEKLQEGAGYHLVAHADGVVTSMVTRNGIPKVTVGTEVKKGDILVEGSIPIYQEDATVKRYEYCVADADVVIESNLSVSETFDERYQKKVYTGRNKKRYFLRINNRSISFPLASNTYELYDVTEELRQIQILGGMNLPVSYGVKNVREYRLEDRIYTKDEIKEKFEYKVQKFIQTLEEKGVQIIEKNVTINKNKSIWKMQVQFVVNQKAEMLQKITPQDADIGE